MLELDDLHRRYGEVAALDGLTFTVLAGRVFGFLGPNGAGKTTAMLRVARSLRSGIPLRDILIVVSSTACVADELGPANQVDAGAKHSPASCSDPSSDGQDAARGSKVRHARVVDGDLGRRWPSAAPAHGSVLLRAFEIGDAPMAVELSTDPYVPLICSLPSQATLEQAQEWVGRQQRLVEQGAGFVFAVVDASTGRALGRIGLWVASMSAGRASIGYLVTPSARGHGVATQALLAATGFAWSLPELHRLELYIEPSNVASVRTAERAGYEREGLLQSHQEIDGSRRDMLMFAAVRPT